MPVYSPEFPLELFKGKNVDRIEQGIAVGKDISGGKSISFVGIAKDSAPWIERNLELSAYIGKIFKSWDGYIYENDSTDETVELLADFHNQYPDNFSYDSEQRPDLAYNRDHSDPVHIHRATKLAIARNEYAKRDYSNTDYVCVVDWDIKGGWWTDGFFHAIAMLEYIPDTACVSAYGILGSPCGNVRLEECNPQHRLMYDSFAYRDINAEEIFPFHSVSQYNHIKCNVGEEPIPVKSNFGGIAIYKADIFNGLKYEAIEHYGHKGCVDCDHVTLNRQIRDKGYNIYMDPTFLSSHSPHRYTHGT